MDIFSSKVLIIGICGRKGAGKDTLTSFFPSFYPNTASLAFATEVRERAAKALCYGGIENMFANQKEVSKLISSHEDILHKFLSRDKVSVNGVDIELKELFRPFIVSFGQTFKTLHGEDIWIKKWENRVSNMPAKPGYNLIVIPDLRFQSEYDWLKKLGGKVVKVIWPDDPTEIDDNPSEKEHLNFECDFDIINFREYDKLYNDFSENLKPMIDTWINERAESGF